MPTCPSSLERHHGLIVFYLLATMSGVGIDAYIVVVVDLFNVDVLVWQGGFVVHYLVGFAGVLAVFG